MVSEVSICNRALAMLGVDPILSFDDDNKAGRTCKANYAPTRNAVFRAYPWNCITQRASLPALVETPAWGFAQQYALPEGPSPARCFRVRVVEGELEGTASPYKVEGRRIVTDDGAPLNILYLAEITDPGLYDPLLADAIAYRFAAEFCYSFTGSRTAAADMRLGYKDALSEARRTDAQEGTPDELLANLWLESRI